ncbi:hypothetical protein DL93DRAFT_2098791 [Clavulina sp. PMI_390]|nr:hypothetical protein DL93DRAFT_2098791 [Clavulina sp. PMI_390]
MATPTASLRALEPVISFDNWKLREISVCFHCREQNFFCQCDIRGGGIDLVPVSWGVPPLAERASKAKCLARFMAMRRRILFAALIAEGTMSIEWSEGEGPIDWDVFVAEHPTLLEAFENCAGTVTNIIQESNDNIDTAGADQDIFTKLREKRGYKNATLDDLRAAAMQAGNGFMRMRWSRISRFGVTLVLKALEKRDPDRFPMTDDLQIVKDAAEALERDFDAWTDYKMGWHVTIEI